MSLVHNVRVGFFGTPPGCSPARPLGADECAEWLRRYNECAPEGIRVRVEPPVPGATGRGVVLGSSEGFPIVLQGGVLTCPYLAAGYLAGAIGFVAFLHTAIGCSIYSDDEGKFLSLEEFVPRESFSAILLTLRQQGTQATPEAVYDLTSQGT